MAKEASLRQHDGKVSLVREHNMCLRMAESCSEMRCGMVVVYEFQGG